MLLAIAGVAAEVEKADHPGRHVRKTWTLKPGEGGAEKTLDPVQYARAVVRV